MWKLEYEAPRGHRIDLGWFGVTSFGDKVYNATTNKWQDGWDEGSCSTHDMKPNSIKAFINYLKRHPELIGEEVLFANRYYTESHGFSIVAKWEE